MVAVRIELRGKRMGYYIEGPAIGKAQHIIDNHGGRSVTASEAAQLVESHGVIAVKNNGRFEAAAFCFNAKEFQEFSDPYDFRPTSFVVIDRAKAAELSSYRRQAAV